MPSNTVGQKLSHFLKSQTHAPTGHLEPPSISEDVDSIDLLAATHPSDHNSVLDIHAFASSDTSKGSRKLKDVKAGRHEREKKARTRQEEEKTQFQRDLAKGRVLSKNEQEARRRLEDGHENAFLLPIPIYFHGVYYGGDNGPSGAESVGSCAAESGHYVDSSHVGSCTVSAIFFPVTSVKLTILKGGGSCGGGGDTSEKSNGGSYAGRFGACGGG